MRTPYYFDFTTTLERNNGAHETEEEIKVTVRVESYAASVGFPNEPCSQREFTITDIEHDGLPLSSLELAELHSRAEDQLSYH